MKFFAQKFEDGYSIMTKKNILLNYSLTLSNTTYLSKTQNALEVKGRQLETAQLYGACPSTLLSLLREHARKEKISQFSSLLALIYYIKTSRENVAIKCLLA